MGFGKFLLGGVAAVGAVIAAPVVLPAAGFAVATSALTGAAGVTAGFAIAGAGATTAGLATAGAIAGGTALAAGNAIEKAQEKKIDEAFSRGVSAGSYGKEELNKAHEKEINAKDKIIETQAGTIKKQDEYIKAQDEYIDRSRTDGSGPQAINESEQFSKEEIWR